MKHRFGNLKILCVIVFIMSCMLFIIWIMVSNSSFNTQYYEKTCFTDEDISFVASYININCEKSEIERMTFSHAKDALFVIYISNISKEDIEKNFSFIYRDSNNETVYSSNSNNNIKCYLSSDQNSAKIRIENYNEQLYKLVKSK